MMIALHKNARTTPAIRAEIASSGDSAAALAQRFGITEATVYKWKKRTSVHDASHTPHRLQTTLTPTQERVVVELRRTLLLPLDDLLAVTREFICPNATRSGLDRCLRRHGVGNLGELKPAQPAPVSKTFKAYEPGYLHIDLKYLPQMQDESSRRYLFVAIDRATRWVFVQIKKNKTAASAKAFLNAVHKACPMRIQKVLTDNGKEFTDRLFASRARQPTGEHEFDQLCASLGIEHRLTKPERRAPTAWSNASTGALPMYCEVTASTVGRSGADAVALCGFVQPPVPPISLEIQNAFASHEGLVR
jgi:transposase-like protein